jgi:hypothetical protein
MEAEHILHALMAALGFRLPIYSLLGIGALILFGRATKKG